MASPRCANCAGEKWNKDGRCVQCNEFPTLGYSAADWIQANCAIPDGERTGEPYVLTDEMLRFLLHHYRLNPRAKFDKRARLWRGSFVHFRGSQLVRPQKWGKPLCLQTEVPTPAGWSTIGELSVGDELFDAAGERCTVIQKTPVWLDAPCYRVTFSDGEEVVAADEHRWSVQDRLSGYAERVLETRELVRLGICDSAGARRWRLPLPSPLALPPRALPIDPYILGLWLGDGTTADGQITCPDNEIFEAVEAAGYELARNKPSGGGCRSHRIYGLKAELRKAGVLGNKHVPAEYLRASRDQRLSLLQGLMDTDGHAEPRKCEFCTTRAELRDGVAELLASLGVKFGIHEGEAKLDGRVTGPKWRISFTARDLRPFRLKRKLKRTGTCPDRRVRSSARHIVSIDSVPSVPTVCITVDSPTETFLFGRRMVQTHNSPFSAAIACLEGAPDSPVLFDGWDANGQPVGRAWSTPWIQVTAVSEDQTDNTFKALLPMIELGALAAEIPDTGLTRINLPSGGVIEPVTSSARSRLGQRITCSIQDELHSWLERNGGHKLAYNQRRNLAGMGGRFLGTTNAWDPGEDSAAQRLAESKAKGVYQDDVEPPKGSVRNKAERRKMMKVVYGDAWWVDLDRIDGEIVALLADGEAAQAERFFLNRKEAGESKAFDVQQWESLLKKKYRPERGALIVIGVDGARFRDAVAVVATEVETGYQWPLLILERPENAGENYEHDFTDLDGAVTDAFDEFDVWRVYCDDQGIDELVNTWQGRYGEKRVIRWHTNRPTPIAWAVRNYTGAIESGDVSHDGDPTMVRHIRNARKMPLNIRDDKGMKMHSIRKDRPNSPHKIDGAMAGVISWEARGDAIADGATAFSEPLVRFS